MHGQLQLTSPNSALSHTTIKAEQLESGASTHLPRDVPPWKAKLIPPSLYLTCSQGANWAASADPHCLLPDRLRCLPTL